MPQIYRYVFCGRTYYSGTEMLALTVALMFSPFLVLELTIGVGPFTKLTMVLCAYMSSFLLVLVALLEACLTFIFVAPGADSAFMASRQGSIARLFSALAYVAILTFVLGEPLLV